MCTKLQAGEKIHVFMGDETNTYMNKKDFRFNTTKPFRNWFEGGQVAGTTVKYEDILTFTIVRGVGHSVPSSQRKRALKMIQTFFNGKSLQNELPNQESIL
ncbi:serine carboxypeptidase-like 44 [Vicia villosa]|uniref:serine carboxypeptidase-like 44 n=1 Tax=Vicia villosa TaxID=3911 RepID=UPI00273B0BC3|nr:serine carboxypeptidase-like 44 [Vicia villosa]